jgi:hypothetical protein
VAPQTYGLPICARAKARALAAFVAYVESSTVVVVPVDVDGEVEVS